MGSSTNIVVAMLLMVVATVSSASLQVCFYSSTCPTSEATVKKAAAPNPCIAAGLIRSHFHDCFS